MGQLQYTRFKGTSFGSVATMGLAMVGIAATTSIPVPLVVGAVVSGAWLVDIAFIRHNQFSEWCK